LSHSFGRYFSKLEKISIAQKQAKVGKCRNQRTKEAEKQKKPRVKKYNLQAGTQNIPGNFSLKDTHNTWINLYLSQDFF